MDVFVTKGTQSDQVFFGVVPEQTARLNMMNLKIPQRTAVLATPAISLENAFARP